MVELIIVITIIAILTTVWFMKFSEYTGQARDSVRTVDFKNVQKALDIYYNEKGEYPEPDHPVSIENTSLNKEQYKWFIEWRIWAEVTSKLRFSQIPLDPQTGEQYSYMVTEDKKKYVLRIAKEDWWELVVWWIPTSCETVKSLWLFKWNWLYTIFFKTRWPIEVFCHQDFREDFYQFILGWDMETDEWNFPTNSNVFFSNEENTTPNWNKSLKMINWVSRIYSQKFTYVDASKNYILSWKVKVEKQSWASWANIWVISFDENFQQIYPQHVRVIEWTETTISRKVNKNDKTIYFACNDSLFNILKTNLVWQTVIAYDVDDSWEYKDLPNRKVSREIWNQKAKENTDSTNIRNNFLKRVSQSECSLKTLNSFLETDVGTKIRFHVNIGYMNYLEWARKYWEWMNYSLNINWQAKYLTSGTSSANNFRPWTKFIKLHFYWNEWWRWENGVWKNSNDTSTTYVDDLTLTIQ